MERGVEFLISFSIIFEDAMSTNKAYHKTARRKKSYLFLYTGVFKIHSKIHSWADDYTVYINVIIPNL